MHAPTLNNAIDRRKFLSRLGSGFGAVALSAMLQNDGARNARAASAGALNALHFAPKAKRIIYLCMAGGPSQIDLFDYKPGIKKFEGQEIPDSVRMGNRFSAMTTGTDSHPLVSSPYKFRQFGAGGAWMSELVPHTSSMADDILVVKSMRTDAINHDPGLTFLLTGNLQPGRPTLGAWLSYGLGNENDNLPSYVVMMSRGSGARTCGGLSSRFWSTGFLPTVHQGVRLRSGEDAVLYLSNPAGIDASTRRRTLDTIGELNRQTSATSGDPEIDTRIAQYEMAFRMQTSMPELVDTADESSATLKAYGLDGDRNDGGFARNCLLARRLAERGVRFVQLMHRGWDQHGTILADLPAQCRDVDQPVTALVNDLKQRGLLKDTLVIWAGEFGRTVYAQGPGSPNYGRDHHNYCFTIWMAGAGLSTGRVYGETDDFSYNVADKPVHTHDLNATILHSLGIDHTKLTYRAQGRDFRLTDVHGEVRSDFWG